MTVGYTRDLDIAQAYTFTPATHRPLGYITALTIGDSVLAPDISVTDPLTAAGPRAPRVVAVLSHLDWSTLPTDAVTLRARVSAPTAQLLRTLATRPMVRIVTSLGVTVYDYDAVANAYYPSLSSYSGTAPKASRAPQPGAVGSDGTRVVYGHLPTTSALRIADGPATDPVGITNVALELTLSPVVAATPQQFRIQSSVTVKQIRPWGIPQA